uniref:Solute carrier family 25 member 10b n=1 Tax=Oncorhynchus mykiss TaxID=8022 RepID=A0A8L0DUF1_ONCMY
MSDKRMSRWYFGGLASCGAACCTHPLDLIKVHLQTQQKGKMGMVSMAMQVVKNDGALALYNGLSASLCRQMSYSLTRFAIYETVRDMLSSSNQGPMPFYQKVLLGAFGGFTGGFIGTPADMVNVRMQNDVKLPPELRRNYKHAVDGLFRVFREEGVRKLFSGATMASSRGALVTVGQLACYDQAKQLVLSSGFMGDNILTHFLSSFIAGGCATFLCQPLDVMKTRLMNSKGEYSVSYSIHPSLFHLSIIPLSFISPSSLSYSSLHHPSLFHLSIIPLSFISPSSLSYSSLHPSLFFISPSIPLLFISPSIPLLFISPSSLSLSSLHHPSLFHLSIIPLLFISPSIPLFHLSIHPSLFHLSIHPSFSSLHPSLSFSSLHPSLSYSSLHHPSLIQLSIIPLSFISPSSLSYSSLHPSLSYSSLHHPSLIHLSIHPSFSSLHPSLSFSSLHPSLSYSSLHPSLSLSSLHPSLSFSSLHPSLSFISPSSLSYSSLHPSLS